MSATMKVRRGTRAQLNALASANGLIQYEPLFITDELRFGVATAVGTYSTAAKEGEGGGAGIWIGVSSPVDPVAYPFWLNSNTFHLYVYSSEDGFINVSLGYQGNLIWSDTSAPVDPLASPFWFNTTTQVLNFYPNSFWGWIALGGGGGGTTYEFALSGLGGF